MRLNNYTNGTATHSLYLKVLSFLLLVFILLSCGSSSGVFEKRKYRKGWYRHQGTTLPLSKESKNTESKFSQKSMADKQSDYKYRSTAYKEETDNQSSKDFKLNTEHYKKESSDINLQQKESTSITHSNSSDVASNSSPIKRSSNSSETSKIKPTPIESNSEDKLISNSGLALGGGFLLLMFLPILFRPKRGLEVQRWAAEYRVKSRNLLILSQVALGGTAYTLGRLLDAPLNVPLLLISSGLIVGSFIFSRYLSNKDQLSNRRKLNLMSVINASISYGAFTIGGLVSNRFDITQWSYSSGFINVVSDPNISEGKIGGEAIITIILLTLLLIGLLILITLLACRISCLGYSALAIVTVVLGFYILPTLYLNYVFSQTREGTSRANFKQALLWGLLFLIPAAVFLAMLFI